MIKLAIYGKGGIGKSTTVSHIAVALAKKGLKVIQIGCDPKADSTLLLRGDGFMPTVLDLVREKGNNFTLEEMTKIGYAGVVCVEAGGPAPGTGCAGRGILVALEKLREKGAYEVYKPDVVLYEEGLDEDVLAASIHHIRQADTLIIAGTSLTVYPAAGLVHYFRGKHLVLINRDVTPMDSQADLVIHDSVGKVFSQLTFSPLDCT